jgi:hypothetical protein
LGKKRNKNGKNAKNGKKWQKMRLRLELNGNNGKTEKSSISEK